MTDIRARIREGTAVVDTLGRGTGRIGRVLVGATSRGPRFFTVREGMLRKEEHLVPCEAVEGVDEEGRLRLALKREQVEMLPDYRGGPPTQEEMRHAYTMLGGLPDDPGSGTRQHSVPYEDTIPRGSAGAGEPGRVDILVEEILVLPAEAREREGYRDEWVVGGGPGP